MYFIYHLFLRLVKLIQSYTFLDLNGSNHLPTSGLIVVEALQEALLHVKSPKGTQETPEHGRQLQEINPHRLQQVWREIYII